MDELARLLADLGYDLRYRPFAAGHNQTGWAESLVDALSAMFPPDRPAGA